MKPIRHTAVYLTLLALASPLFTTANAHGAQQPSSGAVAFARLDQLLAAVERGLAQVERTGTIATDFDIEAALDSYYREANAAFGTAMRAAIEDAKKLTTQSTGTPAAGRRIVDWERRISAHRPRVEKIVAQVTDINLKVRDGRIMFSPELVRSFRSDEKEELRTWLTPQALLKYKGLLAADTQQPTIPKTVISALEMGRPAASPTPASHRSTASSLSVRALTVGASALRESEPALPEPAVAVTCVAVCSNPITAPEGCLPCIVLALGTGSFLATQIDAALDACNRKRTRIGRAICKAGAILGFIVIIA